MGDWKTEQFKQFLAEMRENKEDGWKEMVKEECGAEFAQYLTQYAREAIKTYPGRADALVLLGYLAAKAEDKALAAHVGGPARA